MWGLLISTIFTSAADSLNPFAITQQFVLQGMVKKPKHIWFFIIPTGVTNLIGGFLAYFGLAALIENFFDRVMETHGQSLFIAELILGIALISAVGFLIQRNNMESLKNRLQVSNTSEENDAAEAVHKVKAVSPTALVILGAGATISELTTALPYFAFLAILLTYQLSLFQVTFILVLYNFIYTLPLIILYFGYRKAQNKFDYLYRIIKSQIAKWAKILSPIIVGMIGTVLMYHSASALLIY